jgi:hypothetical protein
LPWLSEFLNIKIRNPCSPLPAPYSHNSHPRAQEAIAVEVNGDEVERIEYEQRRDDRIRELMKKLEPVKLAAQCL